MTFLRNIYIYLIVCFLAVGCSVKNQHKNDIISSPHPLASQAGKDMYSIGGNAFDAAVAAAFTLSVVEPSMSGIGGRLQSIYKTQDGNISGVDATTQVPLNYDSKNSSSDSYGYKTIGIPGVVAGLIKLHEEHGVLDLKTVMAPSIRHAEEGYMIFPGEAKRQASAKDIIESFEGTKHYFLNSDGDSFIGGDIVFQKDLANTLKIISENGREGFYVGEIAEKIVNDIQSNGGLITLDDLKNYSAHDSKILTGSFQGYDIHSLYLPSYGAITIQILQILDNLNIQNENELAIKISSASERAFEYRYYQNNEDSLRSILSYDMARKIANKIDNDDSLLSLKSESNQPVYSDLAVGHTTHLTTADQHGNVVAITQTLGPNMGSKVATKGLGFLYNVTMGPYLGGYLGEDKPGDRASSHISPTLFTNEDEVVLALGAAGGQRIITAITQVAYRYLAQNSPLSDALYLPRYYKNDGILYIEDHLGINRINAQLFPNRYNVERIPHKAYFGRVHAVALDSLKKLWVGSADPDWEGTVSSYYKR